MQLIAFQALLFHSLLLWPGLSCFLHHLLLLFFCQGRPGKVLNINSSASWSYRHSLAQQLPCFRHAAWHTLGCDLRCTQLPSLQPHQQTLPLVPLPHDHKIYASPLLRVGVLPCLYEHVFLLKPGVTYGCLVCW